MSAHRTAWNLYFQVVPILQAEHYQLMEVGGVQGGAGKGDRDRGFTQEIPNLSVCLTALWIASLVVIVHIMAQ